MPSRAKRPIPIPPGVKIEMTNGEVRVSGPKGTLTRVIPPLVTIEERDSSIFLTFPEGEKEGRALGGSVRAHLLSMFRGVEQGFSKRLILEGVGYRVRQEGNVLIFEIGYSHPVRFPFPEGIEVEIEKDRITLVSSDRELLGLTAAKIRSLRPPDPYKGKGIRYEDEVLRLKPGKRAVSTT